MRRPTTLRLHPHRSDTRGSALILTLIFASILALSIAALMLNVRDLTRSTSDKIAYEESYHAAMGGLQMTKAWLVSPVMARAHLGSSSGSPGMIMTAITSGSIALTSETAHQKFIGNAGWATTRTPTEIVAFYSQYNSALGSGASIEGGARRVLYQFTGDVLRFQNDSGSTPSGNLRTASNDLRSKVSKIRITTPYCNVGGAESGSSAAGTWTKDTLLRTSLIVEAEAQTFSQGITKTRWVQQKLMVAPNISQTSETIPGVSESPTLSPGGAIVSGGAIQITGSSHMNVWWGPVQVKGSIDLLDLGTLAVNSDPTVRSFTLDGAGNKLFAAGINNSQDDFNYVDKWVRWQCGPNGSDLGLIYDKSGSNRRSIFPNTTNYGQPAGTYIDDFFGRVMNYNATGANYASGGLNLTGGDYTVNLTGTYANSGTVFSNTAAGIFYNSPGDNGVYPVGGGAYVQQSQLVSNLVTRTLQNDLNYASWKQYAIAKNGYAKPGTGGYINENNTPLWVTADRRLVAGNVRPVGTTRFQDLAQISMKSLVPTNRSTFNIADQILFIDTPQGNPVGVANSGTPGATSSPGQNVNINLNSSDDFFWKGLLYINGNLDTSGGGSFPTIWAQNPDQYAAHPGQVGTGWGHLIQNCYLDGMVYASGTIDRTGNAALYGTLACNGSQSGGGPDVYYNSRNRGGLFQQPPQTINSTLIDPENKRTISGPIRELFAWNL